MPRSTAQVSPEQRRHDAALRPTTLDEVIGQQGVVRKFRIAVSAAKKLNEPLGHVLLDGPPGLGKTTFATVLPNEMGVPVMVTSGPALAKPADLLPFLTRMVPGQVLFIDEVHRLPRAVEEFLYPAMEDFRLDVMGGEGPGASPVSLPLVPFTLIAATTRSGMLSAPLRDRFRMHEHLEYYSVEELSRIVRVNAEKLRTPIDPYAADEIAARSRGTPRVANSRLHWCRAYAASVDAPEVTADLVREALDMAGIDGAGLDGQDRKYLTALIDVFGGGPAGVQAVAASAAVPEDTLADEVEPYLLRLGLIARTPRGRVAREPAYRALGRVKGGVV